MVLMFEEQSKWISSAFSGSGRIALAPQDEIMEEVEAFILSTLSIRIGLACSM